MKKINIKINKKNHNYNLLIGSNILSILPKKLKAISPKAQGVAVVFDKKVPNSLKAKTFKVLNKYKRIKIIINPGEKIKNLSSVNMMLNLLLKNNFNRNDFIINVGGGITGDMVAFTASIYKRGINFINIPTTLLAQVDSSIGGKTGVNNQFGKNLIGTFYQPQIVLIDTDFLKSLKKKELLCGYAEILKHAIIHDKKFFNWLEKNTNKIVNFENRSIIAKAISWSCKIKKYFVDNDPNEKNLRKILNFGHTIAHAIEANSNYSKNINHGEAVLIGMLLETQLSFNRKLCSIETYKKIENIYFNNNLFKHIKIKFNFSNLKRIVNFMENDKKNDDNKINFILLKKIGKTTSPGEIKFQKNILVKELSKLKNFNL